VWGQNDETYTISASKFYQEIITKVEICDAKFLSPTGFIIENKINAEVNSVILPKFRKFQAIAKPAISKGRVTSKNLFRETKTYWTTYKYFVGGKKRSRKYKLPHLIFIVDGKEYKTPLIEITKNTNNRN